MKLTYTKKRRANSWREHVDQEVLDILLNSDLSGNLNIISAQISDTIFTEICGKFAIEHAGILVVPDGPFETLDNAKRWAEVNYKGQTNWRVVKIT